MVYHCSIAVDGTTKVACGTAILPLKTQTAGPAPHVFEGQDVVDEAIYLFRSNVLFRKFDVKGPADRTLIYLTLYINACLKATADAKTKDQAKKLLDSLLQERFRIPGETGFALGGFMFAPKTTEEGELFRGYMKQCREEVNNRILDFCFKKDGTPDKYWYAFAKKTFMNKNLS